MTAAPVPFWQRALGVGIGTAVGGVIYGIFLQALLFQSLIIDKKPLDPAQWKEHLTGKAWICGALYFFTLIFVPLRFITKGSGSAVDVSNEFGVLWFLICLIFLIQIATVVYAYMRPELNSVEHPSDKFFYFRLSSRAQRMSHRSLSVLSDGGDRPFVLLTTSFDLTSWKNWVQIIIIFMEFFQLFSMALNGGTALENVGSRLLPQSVVEFATVLKVAAWQFGMDTASASPTSYSVGFGLLSGFCGFYIFLCGVFIALDLTVDSPLSPLLFTLLAGGFYGIVTSGLLTLIFYSGAVAHVIVGSIMLAYYSSTAVFVSIYRSDLKKTARGEIRIIPTFTAVERVLKGVLSAITVATLSSSPVVKSSIAFVFCVVFSALVLKVRPYSVWSVTLLRFGSVTVSAWTALLVLIASAQPSGANGDLYSGFLLLGWIGIPLALFISNNIDMCAFKKKAPKVISYTSSAVIEVENPIVLRIETAQQSA